MDRAPATLPREPSPCARRTETESFALPGRGPRSPRWDSDQQPISETPPRPQILIPRDPPLARSAARDGVTVSLLPTAVRPLADHWRGGAPPPAPVSGGIEPRHR